MVEAVSNALSLLTILGQVIVLGLIISYFLKQEKILKFFSKNVLLFSFIVASIATLGSLFYSEVAGYEPCKLCWFQRIFMYPQAIILGTAIFRKDLNIRVYSLILSLIGAPIALLHYLLQTGVLSANLPCSAVGYSVACSKVFVMRYGYITIPMMAFTAFLMILAFVLFSFITEKK